MTLNPGKQSMDPKTGRPLIESLMTYKEAPPAPTRHLKPKPGCHRQKKFVPRASYANQPSAEEIRLKMRKEKVANLNRGNQEVDESWLPPETVKVGEVRVQSLGMVSDKITRAGLSAEERGRAVVLKKKQLEEHKQEQAALEHASDTCVDRLTGQLRKKTVGPSAASAQPRKTKEELVREEAGLDIFGRPLPQRPSIQREPDHGVTQGAVEHYDKLLSTVEPTDHARAKARQLAGVVDPLERQPIHFRDPVVGGCPGISVGAPQRPPPQKLPEVDILGQPLKKIVADKPTAHRQKGFLTDNEPAQLYGISPTRRIPHNAGGVLPGYIANPPPAGTRVGGGPTAALSQPCAREAGESTGGPPAATSSAAPPGDDPMNYPVVYERFYASPIYQTILSACKGWGIRRLRFLMKAMDQDGDGMLSKSELNNAILKFGALLEAPQVETLMKLAAAPITKKGGNAMVLIPKLAGILKRGTPSLKRKHIIAVAWKRASELTMKSKGHMTLDDLESVIDFSCHKTFQAHVRGSMREVMQRFANTWGPNVSRTSVIGEDMFTAYFEDMGVSYARESEYIAMMRGMFHLPKL